MYLIYLIVVLLVVYYFIQSSPEQFNDQTGRFCTSCRGKNYNDCLRCFNCGICRDENGNMTCIGGDHHGPYNMERCGQWYHTDPYAWMLKRNANYKCSYGPRSANRIIGI